ncbi:MAG TPA: two-component regulator propeller domain-containing protein [Pyrinomonadaceae bacterium]|jgi:PAS domain S-box-containing protein
MSILSPKKYPRLDFAFRRFICAAFCDKCKEAFLLARALPYKPLMKLKRLYFCSLLVLFLLLGSALPVERLPVRIYTTADGLVNDGINRIVRDSRGFLWFCTAEGLSRFDGFRFKNYTQNEGLPNRKVNDFLETRAGDLLVATRGGLSVFNPNGRAYRWNVLESRLEQTEDAPPMFRLLPLPAPFTNRLKQSVLALGEAPDGKIYVGTLDGVFLIEKSGDDWVWRTKIESEWWKEGTVFTDFQTDAQGFVWTITNFGIFRLSPDEGRVEKVSDEGGSSLLEDRRTKEIWATASGTPSGIRVYAVPSDRRRPPVPVRTYKNADGLPNEKFIIDIMQTRDDKIFAVDGYHALEFLPDAQAGEPKFRVAADGNFVSLAEDAGSNLWFGTAEQGAWKLSVRGFVKFDWTESGTGERGGTGGAAETIVSSERISSLYTSPAGEFYITRGERKISRFADGKFETVEPAGLKTRNYTRNPIDFQTADGEWWIPTPEGMRRYPPVKKFTDLARTAPLKVYTTADGLYSNDVANAFLDSRGDVWMTTFGKDSLQRWERVTDKIIRYTSADDGLPSGNGAMSFAEDADANIWLGFYYGGLARFRGGRFELFTASDGFPEEPINDIFRDGAGRLWISTAGRGVFRVDNPAAEKPAFVNISTGEGLSSNQATCATEDRFGRIYVGTGRGLDRIEPATGNIKIYTQADGLPGSLVWLCGKDASGALWFTLHNELIRFVPPDDEANPAAPSVFIGGVSVGDTAFPVSELGEREVSLPEFNHRQNNLQVNFFSIGFATADQVRFQYRLSGATGGDDDWSEPTAERALTFAKLAPGDYEFMVRAVNAENLTSEAPAVVRFKILRPTWQQGWFIVLCALAAGGVLLAFERYRAAKVRALESAFDEIKISETRFRRLLEQSPLGTVIFAPDGRICSVNRAYEQFWGITFEQIKAWDFLSDPQIVQSGVAEKLRRAFAGEFVVFEPTAYDPRANGAGVEIPADAMVKWILAFAYPVKNDAGDLREVVLVMEDITAKKTAEENLEKVRAEKARELELVRKRIAADLHDDIGSSLTQISILSEVLQQNGNRKNGGDSDREALNLIAASSRELVDAMSDIVWAINPQKDHLSDLVGKMRRFAADSFTPRKIKFTFDAPDLREDLPLGANLRREFFLIFKEAVNNVVKHAACRSAEIVFKIEGDEIHLTVRDDGAGFSENRIDGHGLSSMAERAKSLGGEMKINSSIAAQGGGTSLEICVPLNSLAPGDASSP